jgi:hypothetical protein
MDPHFCVEDSTYASDDHPHTDKSDRGDEMGGWVLTRKCVLNDRSGDDRDDKMDQVREGVQEGFEMRSTSVQSSPVAVCVQSSANQPWPANCSLACGANEMISK